VNHLRQAHRESDTLIGKDHKQSIISLVERKSGNAILKKVSKKTSQLIESEIILPQADLRDD
jgi:IS30 family transposase